MNVSIQANKYTFSKRNVCRICFSSILTIMPEMIVSQKAASFCPSKEIVAIFLRKIYPGLWKSRTLEHKIFYGSGGKVHIAEKHERW